VVFVGEVPAEVLAAAAAAREPPAVARKPAVRIGGRAVRDGSGGGGETCDVKHEAGGVHAGVVMAAGLLDPRGNVRNRMLAGGAGDRALGRGVVVEVEGRARRVLAGPLSNHPWPHAPTESPGLFEGCRPGVVILRGARAPMKMSTTLWYGVGAMGERPERLGDYRITGVLGEGGGGIVYAAMGPKGEVALKVPHADRELSERDRERYLAEAAMMDRVRHASIVEVLASGVLPDGRPFVAMPRLRGRTLAEKVFEDGPLAVGRALDLFEQLADATTALHAADLLHRDLKAENVFLLDGDARAKLLDFGIAKDRAAPTSHTTTGLVRGTPATMAPERFFGAAASEQSDVYELAVVLYVMLAGRLPWAGDETDVKARAHPVPLSVVRPGVPFALSHVLMKALATRPEHRPATPGELATELRAAASQPAPLAAGATVTSQHLRELLVHETPFDAAVASRPEPQPRPRRVAPLAAVAALGLAAAALLLFHESPRTVDSDLSATGVRVAAAAAIAQAALLEASAPSATLPVEEKATVEAAGEPTDEKADRAPAPRPHAASSERRDATKPPGVDPVVPPSTPSPIPGGVYDTPPY
jgi:serine/threonine protein kinase